MKLTLGVATWLFFFSFGANAQIVMQPPSVKGSGQTWDLQAETYYNFHARMVHTMNSVGEYYEQGFIEFDLSAAGLPTSQMTTSNFTAVLANLSVDNGGFPWYHQDSMVLNLFDMGDLSEDNEISAADIGSILGPAIATRSFQAAQTDSPNIFDWTDVTEVLRRDLFGDGTGQPTTGFVLTVTDGTGWGLTGCTFDGESPAVIINVYDDEPDASTDDDSGADGDADTDADTDTEADTGTNANGDNTYEMPKDSCSCRTPGYTHKPERPTWLEFWIELIS